MYMDVLCLCKHLYKLLRACTWWWVEVLSRCQAWGLFRICMRVHASFLNLGIQVYELTYIHRFMNCCIYTYSCILIWKCVSVQPWKYTKHSICLHAYCSASTYGANTEMTWDDQRLVADRLSKVAHRLSNKYILQRYTQTRISTYIHTYWYAYIQRFCFIKDAHLSQERGKEPYDKTAIFPKKEGRKREISNESVLGSSLRETNV